MNKKILFLPLLLSFVFSCMTDKQICYSHSSEDLKTCLITTELSKLNAASGTNQMDLILQNCISYFSKELSCPGEDNTLPINPKR